VQSNYWASTLAKTSTQFSGRGEQVCEYRETFLFREMLIWRLLGDAAAAKRSCCIQENLFQEKRREMGFERKKKLEKERILLESLAKKKLRRILGLEALQVEVSYFTGKGCSEEAYLPVIAGHPPVV
jgi:hypothetical protein